MRKIGKIVAACIVLMLGQATKADFVLTVGSNQSSTSSAGLSFTAGSTVTLGLYMHNNVGVDLKAQNLGLAFDVAEPGATSFLDGNSPGLATKLTDFAFKVDPQFLASATGSFTDPLNVASSTIPAHGYDVLLDLDLKEQANFTASGTIATAKKLGTITFKIANDLAGGVYGFKFAQNAWFDDDILNPSLANSGPAGVGLEAGADGSFYNRFTVITAVPEPSSLMLALLGSSLLMIRRRQPLA